MLWKTIKTLVILLFIGQALFGYAIWLGVPVPASVIGVVLGILGLFGFAAVLLLNEVDEKWDRLKSELKTWRDEADMLIWFINHVAPLERVAQVFYLKQTTFDQMSKAQVRFYQRREKKLAAILEEHPDDAEMLEYHEMKKVMEEEERRLTGQVSNKKRTFWYFHEVVGKVNELLTREETEPIAFDRPSGIKEFEQESPGSQGGTGI